MPQALEGAQLGLFDAPFDASIPAVCEPEWSPEFQRILAEQMLDRFFAAFPVRKRPTIEWRRYRTTAGTASFRRNAIGLNARMLSTEQRLMSTVRHEYAHLLAHHRAGRLGRDHGPAWRQAMADLGGEPDVKHRYECERNGQRQRVVYRCERCGTEVYRHRRLPRGRRYVHVDCGGAIAMQRVEAIDVDR